jgi:photosystem II stability/assembly factor-like uncharacterized protein
MLPITFALLALLPTADDRAINDAPLNAVRFVDRNEGWAAGADGVMWHTIDGGATWERQPLPTKGTIHALQFLTPYTGYAAGREEVQATGGSAGVLLVTKDGGLTWNRLNTLGVSGIQAIEFSDDKHGDVVDSGRRLLRTRDGSLTWAGGDEKIELNGAAHIKTTNFEVSRLLGFTGDSARCGFVMSDQEMMELSKLKPCELPGSRIQAVASCDKLAIAVGQWGKIKVGYDSWPTKSVDAGLPPELTACCDFRGTCCHSDHIWIVGSPGTFALHSADRGKTWKAQPTNSPIPLNAVYFLNHNNGWAVGELGTILSTNDGGTTWKAQMRGGQRSAIMCIQAQGKNLPLDLFALLGNSDGYLVHSVAVASTDDSLRQAMRIATATRKAGGASNDSFCGFLLPDNLPLIDGDQLLKHWYALHGPHATEILTRKLVMQLRTWQPEVVICDFAGGPAETLVVEAVQAAVKQAADPAAFPEQIQVGRLAPWQVKKLFGLWDGPGAPHVTVNTSESVAALNDSPRDYANRVVGLIAEKASLPKQRGLRLLANNMPAGTGLNGIMDGIILAPGGTGRRPAADQVRDVKDPNEKQLRELQNLANVAQSGLPLVGDPTAVMARIGQTLDKLPAEQGMNSILVMAQRAANAGNWPMAKETYELAAARYASQPAGLEAMRWLMRYHSSSEARRRSELKQFASIVRTDFATAVGKNESISIDKNTKPLATGQSASLTDSAMARQWHQTALALEPKLVALGPAATSDPAIQFALAAAKRQLGDTDAGKGYFRKLLVERANNDPWRMAARQELWVTDRVGQPPRFAATCRKTAKRPHLDALFDDECWTDLPGIRATSIGGSLDNYSTTARFAYDDEYLYIALECQHPEAVFRAKVEHRNRDAEVAPYDHVEILFDMDRNYATYYRFRIDQRGALAEDCWGDASWNPRWYVAFKSSPEGYAAEIAIHLHDLTGDAIPHGKAWALNLVRIVPGAWVLAAATPADVVPRPEGCGLLLFADPSLK